jgi:hypothetical protein
MTDVSATDMVDRLRQSVHRLLQWAEAYQPRMLHERERYDADLDEAEVLLDASGAWLALHADDSPRLRAEGGRRMRE